MLTVFARLIAKLLLRLVPMEPLGDQSYSRARIESSVSRMALLLFLPWLLGRVGTQIMLSMGPSDPGHPLYYVSDALPALMLLLAFLWSRLTLKRGGLLPVGGRRFLPVLTSVLVFYAPWTALLVVIDQQLPAFGLAHYAIHIRQLPPIFAAAGLFFLCSISLWLAGGMQVCFFSKYCIFTLRCFLIYAFVNAAMPVLGKIAGLLGLIAFFLFAFEAVREKGSRLRWLHRAYSAMGALWGAAILEALYNLLPHFFEEIPKWLHLCPFLLGFALGSLLCTRFAPEMKLLMPIEGKRFYFHFAPENAVSEDQEGIIAGAKAALASLGGEVVSTPKESDFTIWDVLPQKAEASDRSYEALLLSIEWQLHVRNGVSKIQNPALQS